jgi:Two component regulator propeller
LTRLDKNGRWQLYSKDDTKGGLPDDSVRALAIDADGALWIGTWGGLRQSLCCEANAFCHCLHCRSFSREITSTPAL